MTLALTLGAALLVPGFMIWLVTYCLRVGAVGNAWSGHDAHRDKQPIRFWMRIVTLGGSAAVMVLMVVYLAWETLLH
jgi:hypothetical protein